MKNLILICAAAVSLSACASPAVVAIPAVFGAGLAINTENYNKAHPENPIDTVEEVKYHLVKGVKEGFSQ